MQAEIVAALLGDVGRGFTVLCTSADPLLLARIACEAGATGLLLAVGSAPPSGAQWHALRADPAALPLRSHIVDAAILDCTRARLSEQAAEETRRALVPGGALRVLVNDEGEAVERALSDAALRTVGWLRIGKSRQVVLVARGP